MKISYNWLKTLIQTGLKADDIAAKLTACGLEVEGMETFESVPGGLKGLVVGHVLECAKHPDADRLSLTRVNVGAAEPLSIVCGAPNVAAGQKVIVALVGAKLYPSAGEPFEIKKSKIRGAVSEGMICAEDEIGLGQSHAGILILPENTPTGLPAADYFKVENDTVFEIGLTPNRSDAASHLGVARDLAAILNSAPDNNAPVEVKVSGLMSLPEASGLEKITIDVKNPEACRRYSGMVISSVTVGHSPAWLQNRLKAIGLRPINNIVDITNFVLHELGQPLHAFDTEKIRGRKVVVRTASEGEKFVTLDGVERTLHADDLMICNAENGMCLAGVFGGAESGVTEATTSVFLESAYFDPGFVRRTAKRHGLKTDASFRFERGTDPEITTQALLRAANLILEMAGGTVSMEITDWYPEKMEPVKVAFSYSNCTELIGKEIEKSSIRNILLNLGIEIETEGSDGLLLRVPRFKTDVIRTADVVEEVMRIYGYNNVEAAKHLRFAPVQKSLIDEPAIENKTANLLTGFGFSEIMSLSLTRESYYTEGTPLVKVLNPLSSDLNALRADLLYSGLEAIAYNINRKQGDLKLFEFGRVYGHKSDADKNKYTEQKQLALFATGSLFRENPYGFKQKSDVAYLRSVVEAILEKNGIGNCRIAESTYAGFSGGLSFTHNNKTLAELGQVSKKLLKSADISQDVYYACIHWEALVAAAGKHKTIFADIPKFPAVRRDLALMIDKQVKYSQVEELAYATERKLLKEVNLFDVYESEKLGNKKSYAVSFTLLNPEATLTDKQIDGVMEKLIKNYREKLGAELR